MPTHHIGRRKSQRSSPPWHPWRGCQGPKALWTEGRPDPRTNEPRVQLHSRATAKWKIDTCLAYQTSLVGFSCNVAKSRPKETNRVFWGVTAYSHGTSVVNRPIADCLLISSCLGREASGLPSASTRLVDQKMSQSQRYLGLTEAPQIERIRRLTRSFCLSNPVRSTCNHQQTHIPPNSHYDIVRHPWTFSFQREVTSNQRWTSGKRSPSDRRLHAASAPRRQ